MNVFPAQGIWLRTPFANGNLYDANRPFIVIDTEPQNNQFTALNVSSSRGKEKKLLYSSNKKLVTSCSPFPQPSFVKMDEIYVVEYDSRLDNCIENRKGSYRSDKFQELLTAFEAYKIKYPQDLQHCYRSIQEIHNI